MTVCRRDAVEASSLGRTVSLFPLPVVGRGRWIVARLDLLLTGSLTVSQSSKDRGPSMEVQPLVALHVTVNTAKADLYNQDVGSPISINLRISR